MKCCKDVCVVIIYCKVSFFNKWIIKLFIYGVIKSLVCVIKYICFIDNFNICWYYVDL